MARGIHLKQLTRENLEVLGLPEGTSLSVSGEIGTSEDGPAESLGHSAHRPDQTPDEAVRPRRRHVGPPSNPASAIAQAEDAEPDPDWQPLDLRALTRQLCVELEITLRLLEGPANQGPGRD